MAVNLNPGADQTLVAAAYRSAMANVPKDLSGTFEALAASYDETMQSVADSWSGVIKDVATLGSAAVATAIKNSISRPGYGNMIRYSSVDQLSEEKRAEIGTYKEYAAGDQEMVTKLKNKYGEIPEDVDLTKIVPGSDKFTTKKGVTKDRIGMTYGELKKAYEGATLSEKEWEELNLQNTPIYIGDELTNIRKGLRALWGKTDRDSVIKRQELKSHRDKLFSELDFLENVDNFNNENLANGLIDEGATGKLPLLMQNALSAYKTKSKKILEGDWAGYHVVPTRDGNDDLNFILKDPEGRVVTGQGVDGEILTERGGKPYSISTSKMNSLLTPKYDETRRQAWNKMFDGLLASNIKNFSDIGYGNKARDFVQTEEELFGLMGHNPGNNSSNFVDDLNNPSGTSAAIFSGMGQVKLAEMGVKDIGKKGYDAEDFIGEGVATQNYKIVKDALLNKTSGNYDFKTTQNAFIEYVTDVASKMHKFKNPNAIKTIQSTQIERDLSGFVKKVKNKNSIIGLGDNTFKLEKLQDGTDVYYTMDENDELAVFTQYELQANYGGNFSNEDIGGGKRLSPDQRQKAKNELQNKGFGGSSSNEESLSDLIGEETDDIAVKGLLKGKSFQYKGNEFSFKTHGTMDGNYVTASITVDGKLYKKKFSTNPVDETALSEFLNDPTLIKY
jgi:hypothetical protein